MTRIEDSSDRLLSIHYLRAIAAAMVVIYHVFSHQLVNVANPDHVRWLKDGVAIFFVISGFVMASSTSGRPSRPGPFFGRRLLRIVPLYWIVTVSYALVTHHVDRSPLLHSLFFVPQAESTGATRPPVVEVGWTLNYEMAFYALFALSMLLPQRFALWALCIVLGLLAILGGVTDGGPLTSYYTAPFWWEFVAGMLIARLGLRTPAWCLPLGFALLAIGPPLIGTRFLATSLPAALIVTSARSLDNVLRPWPLPVLLGDASYAIYLTHLFVIFPLANSFGSAGNPLVMLLSVPTSIAIGVCVHLAVEKPLADIVRYRKKPAAPVGSALLSP
jgi:exopolysaccharide production protein ExoZ